MFSKIRNNLKHGFFFFMGKTFKKLVTRLYSYGVGSGFESTGKRFTILFPCVMNAPRSIRVGAQVRIGAHAWLNAEERSGGGATLVIGDGTSIGRFVHINARESVIIEKNVLMADKIFITDYQHASLHSSVPILAQGLLPPKPVRIREGAWLGEGAAIMPGVTVGKNAVIGAHAVVTEDVPDNHVAVGVPAVSRPKAKPTEELREYARGS